VRATVRAARSLRRCSSGAPG